MKMLQKMGWNFGQPLGKTGDRVIEPIAMPVKVDRAGMGTGSFNILFTYFSKLLLYTINLVISVAYSSSIRAKGIIHGARVLLWIRLTELFNFTARLRVTA